MEKTNGANSLYLFILGTAVINIIAVAAAAGVRFYFRGYDALIFDLQAMLSVVKVIFIIFLFVFCCFLFKAAEEPSKEIKELLMVWGAILIGAQIIYNITTILYGNVLDQMMLFLGASQSNAGNAGFAVLYNGTHGFKYIGMFIAMLLGLVVTGVILKKKSLAIISGMLAVIFMIAFCTMNMWTMSLSFLNYNLGIVWTSFIFHALQTVGLFILGIYLKWRV